jgi:hypothetical protein
MLTKLLNKQPDEILGEMLQSNFQLQTFLNDNRMETKYDWIFAMTTLLERITTCIGSRERIALILEKLPDTKYLEGVYNEIRQRDIITDELRYGLIQSFLKVSNQFLAMMPHSANDLTKILERIELMFTKIDSKPSVRLINLICFVFQL